MDADEELLKEEAAPAVKSLFPDKAGAGNVELAESLQKLLDDIDSENSMGKHAVIFFEDKRGDGWQIVRRGNIT